MWIRHAILLVALTGSLPAAHAEGFRIEEVATARDVKAAQLKSGVIAFSDRPSDAGVDGAVLVHFDDWARTRPTQKKFLALFPGYTEPSIAAADTVDGKKADPKPDAKAETSSAIEKLYIYLAQARFILDRPPGAVDLSRYVTPAFLEKIDPAIKHKVIAAGEVHTPKDQHGTGNENPDRKWCSGRPTLVCIESSYKLEGKIPLGITLANKLRESAKKISDRIDFYSELSQRAPADPDLAGVQELTALDTAVVGALEQNIFYVNQVIKFGKFLAVFQASPTDANKTVVSAFMALAIEASVLDKKREFADVPVLRNLVPLQVLMGKSSFNSGASISAGLPQYARNEIRTVADILAHDK